MEDQVEVVNHQIVDHRDVGSARLEGGEPGALEVPEVAAVFPGGAEGTIEPLDVTDLQLHSPGVRRGHQPVRFFECAGQRFLDQDRLAGSDRSEPHLAVDRGRDGDGDGIDPRQQLVEISERGRPDFGRHGLGPLSIEVAHSGQPHAVESREVSGVVAAQGPYPDHPDGQGCGHAGTPRCELVTNSTSRSTSSTPGKSSRTRSSAWVMVSSELKKSR